MSLFLNRTAPCSAANSENPLVIATCLTASSVRGLWRLITWNSSRKMPQEQLVRHENTPRAKDVISSLFILGER